MRSAEWTAALPGVGALPGPSEARRRLVPWQGAVLVGAAMAAAWAAAAGVRPFLQGLALVWMGCYWLNTLYRLWLAWQSWGAARAGDAFAPTGELPADEECPSYTILLPLYHEAPVVPQLVAAIRALDYPTDRLQVLCILRPEDEETRGALVDAGLPGHFRILALPEAVPVGTKPAACNYGLAHATGERLAIFDAEDLPEPLQLRKAAAALRLAPPDVAVVQTPKPTYGGGRSFISRMYELEALTWHRLFLPGITARERFAPLHGSGAHFRTEVLRRMGGFDYYNVTEDCDLGIRLYRQGYRIELLQSATGEEAPPCLRDWLRQRTRWNKGFLQTLFVHTRKPAGLARALGPRRSLALFVLLPLALANVLVGAPAWVGAFLWIALGPAGGTGGPAARVAVTAPAVAVTAPAVAQALLVSGSALAVLAVALFGAGAVAARRWSLLPYLVFVPLYWALLAAAAYRAAWHFATAPFGWEKTPHGRRPLV